MRELTSPISNDLVANFDLISGGTSEKTDPAHTFGRFPTTDRISHVRWRGANSQPEHGHPNRDCGQGGVPKGTPNKPQRPCHSTASEQKIPLETKKVKVSNVLLGASEDT